MARQRGPSVRKGDWKISLRSLVSVRWQRGIPRLRVHEKYETAVKWIMRVLTLVGIASALVSMPPLAGVVLAVVLLAIEQFFERAVFEYTTIYVLPMPDFAFDSASWIEMAYALPADPDGYSDATLPSYCMLVFDNYDQAAGVMRLLRAWASGPHGDDVDNLVVSFIWEEFGGYSVYVYPDLERRELERVFEETRLLQIEEKLTKQQQGLVMFFKLGKYFSGGSHLRLDAFLSRQTKTDAPFLFGSCVKGAGEYNPVDDAGWIVVSKYRVLDRASVPETAVEWQDPAAVRRLRKAVD